MFKEGIKKYLIERKEILPDSELEDIEKFVNDAKPKDFCIMNLYTKKLVQYSPEILEKFLNIYFRDKLFMPRFGTHYIGHVPNLCADEYYDTKHLWYIRILNGVE